MLREPAERARSEADARGSSNRISSANVTGLKDTGRDDRSDSGGCCSRKSRSLHCELAKRLREPRIRGPCEAESGRGERRNRIQRERRPRKRRATRHCASERGPEPDPAWWAREAPNGRDLRTPREGSSSGAERDVLDGSQPSRRTSQASAQRRSSLATTSLRGVGEAERTARETRDREPRADRRLSLGKRGNRRFAQANPRGGVCVSWKGRAEPDDAESGRG